MMRSDNAIKRPQSFGSDGNPGRVRQDSRVSSQTRPPRPDSSGDIIRTASTTLRRSGDQALTVLWEAVDRICSKRLKVLISVQLKRWNVTAISGWIRRKKAASGYQRCHHRLRARSGA